MDPLSHCLVGAVAAKSVGAKGRRFWAMTALGGIADIDLFANALGPWAEFLQHRSVTHSLFGTVLMALLFSVTLSRWDPGRFSDRLYHYSLPLVLHLVCDLLTPFGIPLLLPFSARNFSWDLLGSVNIIPGLFMSGALLWFHRRHLEGWRATRAVWAAWGMYLCLALSGKAYAAKLANVGPANAGPGELTALPSLYNPFRWRTVLEDKSLHEYKYFDVNLLQGRVSEAGEFKNPLEFFPVKASLRSAEVARFLQDHRWPAVRVTATQTGWNVEWGTLIFSTLGPVRGKLVVAVGRDGRLQKETKVVDFWDPQS